jgi:hypothetical protein
VGLEVQMLIPDRILRRISKRGGRRSWVVAPVVLVLISSILVGTLATTAAAAFPSKLMPSSGVYFGARVAPRGNETNEDAIKRVESKVGRKLDIDHQYYLWDANIPTGHQRWDVDTGRIPFINWNAGKGGGSVVRWSAIANGSQDAWIRQRADAFKAFGAPIYLAFHHEPEDDLSRFGSPADFAAAFRHIVTVFRSRSVTNVAFVWTMMAWTFNPRSGRDAMSYYPGDSYIDFVGADGYSWYPTRSGDPWTSFQDIFTDVNAFSVAHHKPWMVVEYGCLEDPLVTGRKAQWFRDALTTAKTWPALKALIYFDVYKIPYHWETDTSSSSMSAYRQIALDPYTRPGSGGGPSPSPSPSPRPSPSPSPSPRPSPSPSPSPTPPPGGTLTNNLNLGPNGAAILANQAQPPSNPFNVVSVSRGASLVFDNHGNGRYSAKHVLQSGADSYYEWTGTRSVWYGHVYVWLDALPPTNLRLIRGASSGSLRCAIDIMPNGTLQALDSVNRPIVNTSVPIATGQWIRIDWMVDHRHGVVQVRLFNSSASLSPTEIDTSRSGSSIGSSANEFEYGRSGSQPFAITFWTDNPALSSTGYPA